MELFADSSEAPTVLKGFRPATLRKLAKKPSSFCGLAGSGGLAPSMWQTAKEVRLICLPKEQKATSSRAPQAPTTSLLLSASRWSLRAFSLSNCPSRQSYQVTSPFDLLPLTWAPFEAVAFLLNFRKELELKFSKSVDADFGVLQKKQKE